MLDTINARLSIPARLALIGALFLIPIGLLVYLFVRQSLQDIEFARRELDGSRYLAEVWPGFASVARTRKAETGPAADRAAYDAEFGTAEASQAYLAAAGCGELIDASAESTVLFDIGGGSSEIVWMTRGPDGARRVAAWESLRLGVVSLAETFGGDDVTPEIFDAMVSRVDGELETFAERVADLSRCERFHLLGTSGTVTTLAGVHLDLPRYDRRAIDGLWLTRSEVDSAVSRLRAMSYAERAANGCIGVERADLVLAGCAILEAIRGRFPAERVRIADRGLREGILSQMMRADRTPVRYGG